MKRKITVLTISYPTRNREFKKSGKKVQNTKKHHYGHFFHVRTVSERVRKGENNNYRSDHFQPEPLKGIQKKKKKKSKKTHKLKNSIMASFQGKPGWERPRERENKNYFSNQILPDT